MWNVDVQGDSKTRLLNSTVSFSKFLPVALLAYKGTKVFLKGRKPGLFVNFDQFPWMGRSGSTSLNLFSCFVNVTVFVVVLKQVQNSSTSGLRLRYGNTNSDLFLIPKNFISGSDTQCCGSGLDPESVRSVDPDSESRSGSRPKTTHKNIKKLVNMFEVRYWMFSFQGWRLLMYRSLDLLYGGLGISTANDNFWL